MKQVSQRLLLAGGLHLSVADVAALVGFFLGENVDLVDRILRNFGWVMLGILVVGIGFYVWWRRRSTEGAR